MHFTSLFIFISRIIHTETFAQKIFLKIFFASGSAYQSP